MFPFDRPAAPEEDGNQSLAVNTTDGSVVYDVAFALVWADDGEDVTTRNEAYAFASCADCAAVAVGFQVVLIVGQTDVIVPENLSAAANYNCVRCLTYALASQLVLTLDGPLSADGMARLNELWQQIAEYGRNLQNVPLSEIQGRLDAFKAQIMEVIKNDPSATPAASTGTAPATTGSSPGPSESATPGATPGTTPATGAEPQPAGTAPAATAPAATSAAHCTRGTAAHAIRGHLHRTGSGDAVAGSNDDGPAGTLGRGAVRQRWPLWDASRSGHLRRIRRVLAHGLPGLPFVREDGVDHLGGPLSLVVPLVHLGGFQPHAEPFAQRCGGRVEGIQLGVDPVEAEFPEAQLQQGCRRPRTRSPVPRAAGARLQPISACPQPGSHFSTTSPSRPGESAASMARQIQSPSFSKTKLAYLPTDSMDLV